MAAEKPEQTETFASNPWLRAIKSLQGKIVIGLGLLSVLGPVFEKMVGFLDRIGVYKPPWNVLIWLLIAAAACTLYVREVLRARRLPVRHAATAFIGVSSFTERDEKRFFGRDDEIEEITRKLVDDPQLRILTLFGDSACGKTSLIRAGLIPELSKRECATLYVRLYDSPVKSLREALRAINASATDSRPTLFADLRAAHARSGKGTLILFIDQFQEFFINPPPAKERKLFFDFVRETVGTANAPFKLVFAIRSDFFHCMTDFDGYVEGVLGEAKRKRIDPFTSSRARAVMHFSLLNATQNASEGPFWEDGLIERVLKDLEIERRGGIPAEVEPVVLPAELQIVCQMVQRRGWTRARQYTGKERLIRDYLNEAIDASPNPSLSKRVLAAMVQGDGVTRAQPQMPAELAAKISALTEADADRYLKYFEIDCRLVNQVVRQESTDPDREIAYELAHDYLVNIINSFAADIGEESKRANVALEEHRRRYKYSSKYRLPIADWWRIRKYATAQITAEDRSLLRRSARAFAYRTGAVILLPMMCGLAVRYSMVHFDVRHENYGLRTVVVKRGLPFLKPVLGSDTTLVNTGISPDALAEEGEAACKNEMWVVRFGQEGWAGRIKRWHKEKLLKGLDAADPASVARAAEELLKLKLVDERLVADKLLRNLNRPKFEQSREVDLSRLVDLLLRLNAGREVVEQPLIRMWKNRRPGGESAALLLKVGVQDSEVVSTFCRRFREQPFPYLSYLGSEEVQVKSPLLRYYSDKSTKLNGVRFGLDVEGGVITNFQRSDRERTLADDLNDAADNYRAAYDLSILTRDGREAQEPWLVELLRERLTAGTAEEIVAAARTLAKLKVHSPWVREILQPKLREESAVSETQQPPAPYIERQRIDKELMVLAAAHSLFISGMGDSAVLDTLRARLSEARDTTSFWLVVDLCVRHKVKEQWLKDALLKRLHGSVVDKHNNKDNEIAPEQEESALAAAALIQTGFKSGELTDWLLQKLDPRETAVKAAQDLGELCDVDDRLVADALRRRLEREMEEGDEADAAVLGSVAKSLVQLGEHHQVVLSALRKSIEKARGIDGGAVIRESVKTLRTLAQFDEQAVAVLRNRLNDGDILIGRAVPNILADFDVRDEATLVKLREQLDSSDNRFEVAAAAYAKLALVDSKRGFEGELEHLWKELLSPAADSSVGYRRAVQEAFKLLAERQLKNGADGAKAIAALRAKLSELYSAVELHRQVAAYETLETINEVVKKGSSDQFSDGI